MACIPSTHHHLDKASRGEGDAQGAADDSSSDSLPDLDSDSSLDLDSNSLSEKVIWMEWLSFSPPSLDYGGKLW